MSDFNVGLTPAALPPALAAVVFVASPAKRYLTVRAGNDHAGGSRPARLSACRNLFVPPPDRVAASASCKTRPNAREHGTRHRVEVIVRSRAARAVPRAMTRVLGRRESSLIVRSTTRPRFTWFVVNLQR